MKTNNKLRQFNRKMKFSCPQFIRRAPEFFRWPNGLPDTKLAIKTPQFQKGIDRINCPFLKKFNRL
jgi:hypothetical protein